MTRKLLRITTVPESLRTLLPGQLAFMREQGFTVWAASAGPVPPQEIDGCRHFVLPLVRPISPLRDLWALLKTCWLIWRLRPDIVHTHTPKAGLIGMWAAWFTRVPVRLHTVAGLPLMEKKGPTRWLLVCTERLTYLFATGVWPNSFGLEAYIRQTMYTGSKLRVIGKGSSNGIDTTHFQPTLELIRQADVLKQQRSIPTDAFVWVFVGRIVRDKGIDELVMAFSEIAVEHRHAYLLLVGYEETGDPIGEKTKQLIRSSKKILSVGYRADVRPYILVSNALILPSYREGLPNVLLQAACLERPVVATDIVGGRDVVIEGETGLLVAPKDPVALRDTMLQLMADPSLRQQMGVAARAHVVDRYDQQRLWQDLLLAYKQALTSTKR